MAQMDDESRKTLLVITVIILMIVTLAKCFPLAKQGDADAFWAYLIGYWLISGAMIYWARIGKRPKFKGILFGIISLPVTIFALLFLISSIQSAARPIAKLLKALDAGNNAKVAEILEKENISSYHVYLAAEAAIRAENTEALIFLDQEGDGLLALAESDYNSLLDLAVGAESIVSITTLLELGFDPNEKDDKGRTILHRAVKTGNIGIIRTLIDKGADPAIADDRGYPPANSADSEIAEYLEGLGAGRIEIFDDENTALHMAVRNNEVETVKRILELGKIPVDIRNRDDQTPLHIAAEIDNAEIAALLIEAGADPNVQEEKGRTPLLIAASGAGGYSICQMLLDAGSETDFSGTYTQPLEAALQAESPSKVRLLLEHGSKITEDSIHYMLYLSDQRIISLFKENLTAEGAWTVSLAAFAAVDTHDTYELKRLIDAGADLRSMVIGGNTISHQAALNCRDTELFDLLRDNNIVHKSKNDRGARPLDLAIENDNGPAFDLYWPYAMGTTDVEQDTLDTYLRQAIQDGSPEVVSRLIRMGADVNNLRKSGGHPLGEIPFWIIRKGEELSDEEKSSIWRELVRELVQAGANPEMNDKYGSSGYSAQRGNDVIMAAMEEEYEKLYQ